MIPTAQVGWLVDEASYVGGAELTCKEFLAAKPEHVEIVPCPPGGVIGGLDRYVIQNCVTFTVKDLERADNRRVKYWHDVGSHVSPEVKTWLARHTVQVCCSPVQAEAMGIEPDALIPPPVDLDRFAAAGDRSNGSRSGNVAVGQWRNAGKSADVARVYGERHGGIDFYGGGMFAPPGCVEVPYAAMPDLLARYETFVHLPSVVEPFGRSVAEAYAAGCAIVSNRLVGALWWIEHDMGAIARAAEDFWKLVLA
jgi:hypothetical protein